jgi:hypothetical protein
MAGGDSENVPLSQMLTFSTQDSRATLACSFFQNMQRPSEQAPKSATPAFVRESFFQRFEAVISVDGG